MSEAISTSSMLSRPTDATASPSRCRTSSSSRTCFSRCTSSSRATARWSADALAGDRIIGMALLQPGIEADYEGRPPCMPGRLRRRHHATQGARRRSLPRSCPGAREIPDGTEEATRPCRIGHVEALPDVHPRTYRCDISGSGSKPCLPRPSSASGPNRDFRPRAGRGSRQRARAVSRSRHLERQALLECDGALARCRALIELLEMQTLTPKGAGAGGALEAG